jgi:hypothetical protein
VGDPLPPALRKPMQVRDLAAVEHGSKIIIQFTLPKLTTEGLDVRGDEDVELRAGTLEGTTFELNPWVSSSARLDVKAKDGAVLTEVDATKYENRLLVIGVRVHGPKGRDAGWSIVVLPVVTPLTVPTSVKAENAPDAVRLTWLAPAGEFRVFRRVKGTTPWLYQGNSLELGFTDPTVDFGTEYEYFVQSVRKVDDNKFAESDLSDVVAIEPVDKFAPATPVGLSAASGTRTIELVWERNTEKDMAFYRVYRDGSRLADNVAAASFSDDGAEAGKTYKYQVSAVDTAGNESALSAPIEAAIR